MLRPPQTARRWMVLSLLAACLICPSARSEGVSRRSFLATVAGCTVLLAFRPFGTHAGSQSVFALEDAKDRIQKEVGVSIDWETDAQLLTFWQGVREELSRAPIGEDHSQFETEFVYAHGEQEFRFPLVIRYGGWIRAEYDGKIVRERQVTAILQGD